MALNSPNDYFHLLDNGFDVQPGAEIVIRVQPSQLVFDDNVKSVSIDQRKCRFKDEVPSNMTLFKVYSRKACLFNCMHDFR